MTNGIYITKIVVRGPTKPIAKLELNKGINVISGASDTGKSYITDCMDFIFGSSKSPKEIEEAQGYNEVIIEIHTLEGKTFTISRNFNDSQLYLAECSYEDFDTTPTIKLSSIHNPNNDNNISSFLLNIIGLKGKKLKRNDRNEKRDISFRDLARFCLINEEKIISEESPVLSGQVILKTVEDSLFRLILSGKDDDELETFEDPKIFKSKVNGKIELIESQIEGKEKVLQNIKDELKKFNLDGLSIQIEELSGILEQVNKNVISEEEKRQEIWKRINELNSKIVQIKELKARFNLLNEHYGADLGRLEFINEGSELVGQLGNVNCPLCGTLVKQGILEQYEEDKGKIKDSIKEEYQKIQKKKKELVNTLENLEKDKTNFVIEITNEKNKFEEIENYINSKLKPVYDVNKDKLNKLFKIKEQESKIVIINEGIKELKKDKEYYKTKLTEKQERGNDIKLSDAIYQGLAKDIKEILCSWGIKCRDIYYKKSDNDILINGKNRKNFGKGYRAIYLSAFVIAVLKYCINNNLNHPHFIMLDSPLTTYKESDVAEGDIDAEDIQEKFFKSIAELNNLDQLQILIIDNKEPPEDLNINHIHFSGNKRKGRYGFFL